MCLYFEYTVLRLADYIISWGVRLTHTHTHDWIHSFNKKTYAYLFISIFKNTEMVLFGLGYFNTS